MGTLLKVKESYYCKRYVQMPFILPEGERENEEDSVGASIMI